MASTMNPENTRAPAPTTPTPPPNKVLAAIHNLPRRMRSGTLRNMTAPAPPPPLPAPHAHTARALKQGKENTPPTAAAAAVPPRRRRPAPLLPKSSKHIFGLGGSGGGWSSPRDLDAPSPPASASRFPSFRFGAPHAPPAGPPLPSAHPTAAPAAPAAPAAERWAPRDGHIVIKVWVPTTDDIWAVRVPATAGGGGGGGRECALGLAAFRARVAEKVGFAVSFAAVAADGRLRAVEDEEAFRRWVAGRVRGGRNTLLTAHRLGLL
ncbi:hypothetical protein BC628DRAFT_1418662 [Trametes gibbosa]|nr:hypothetical protein BC628DRAFT_1418662 [Trametes gibbosa]